MLAMKTLHTRKTQRPVLLALKLFKLERSGKYEEGLAEVGDIWVDKTTLPRVEEFAPIDAAEMLLRCGSLFGFLGHTKHLPKSQETSRDLLMNARNRFQEIYNIEKIAECETYLALAYWRTGEYNEAKDWLSESLQHTLAPSNNTRLFTQLISCLLNLSSKNYAENRQTLTALEKYFLGSEDDYLIGDFYNHLGLAEKGCENLEKALRCFEMSRHYHQKSGHLIYQGTAGNNIAQIYKQQRKFTLAHNAIDRSASLFRQAKDKTREGFAYDTKALIYLAEGKHPEALAAAEKGVAILRRGENSGYLADTLMTKSLVEVAMTGTFSTAMFSVVEAVNIARQMTDEQRAQRFISEFDEAVERKRLRVAEPDRPSVSAKEELRLILPPALAHYTDCQGVWINNSHLEAVGLWQGSLAIVVNQLVRRGDLVAISEKATEEVSCGFYDFEFGIIGLQGPESEPQLFEEDKITVLGRIVGVCDPAKETGGKLTVEPINPVSK